METTRSTLGQQYSYTFTVGHCTGHPYITFTMKQSGMHGRGMEGVPILCAWEGHGGSAHIAAKLKPYLLVSVQLVLGGLSTLSVWS